MLEDVTRRWVAGWAHSRGISVGTVEGWPIAHVRAASRAWEIICAEPDQETWEALLDDIAGDRSAMLTVVAADPAPYLSQVHPPVRVERDDEWLMRRGLTGDDDDARAPAYDVEREEEGDQRLVVRLVRDGRVAAEGYVAVRGVDAVFDRIETSPQFRREGLATWVMGALTGYAVGQGATTGLLTASAEGASLYASLGWERVAPVRSLMGA